MIIILANVMGLGWQKRVFQFTGAAPLPENLWVAGIPPMVMAFLIGGIIIILSVLSFSILIAAMPRSGGGYVVISRLVSPIWAFVGSWFEFLSIAWSFGIIAVAVFEGKYRRCRVNDFNANAAPAGFPGNRGSIDGIHDGMMAL